VEEREARQGAVRHIRLDSIAAADGVTADVQAASSDRRRLLMRTTLRLGAQRKRADRLHATQTGQLAHGAPLPLTGISSSRWQGNGTQPQ